MFLTACPPDKPHTAGQIMIFSKLNIVLFRAAAAAAAVEVCGDEEVCGMCVHMCAWVCGWLKKAEGKDSESGCEVF